MHNSNIKHLSVINYTFCYLPSCFEYKDEEREALQVLKEHDLNPVVCTIVT